MKADEQGPGTKIQFVTDEGQEAKGFVVAAGSMFPLGSVLLMSGAVE